MFSQFGSHGNLCLRPFVHAIRFTISRQVPLVESDIYSISVMMHPVILVCRFEEFVAKVIMKHRGVDKDAVFEYDGVSVAAFKFIPIQLL